MFPPDFIYFVALVIPSTSSVISLLTKILSAWKVFVETSSNRSFVVLPPPNKDFLASLLITIFSFVGIPY